jgi:hypothetical protein
MNVNWGTKMAAIGLLAAVLVAGCSSSTPRYSAVFSPTPEPVISAAVAPSGGASAAASVDTSGWIEFAPAGASLSVLMPSQPVASTAPMKTPIGTASSTSWTYTDPAHRVLFATDVKFPAGALAKAPAKSVLDGATPVIVATVPGAKLSAQSDVTLGGHQGRSISYGTDKIAVACHIYIVGDDIEGVCSVQPAGQADDGQAQAFLASFQLTA